MENLISSIGEIKGYVQQLPEQYKRLDARINGSFSVMSEHMNDSSNWRSRIVVLETAVSNMKVVRDSEQKSTQWRVALIVSVVVGILSNIDKILNLLFMLAGKSFAP